MTAAQGHVGFTLYNAFWQPNVEPPSSTRASCSCRACSLVGQDHIWWLVWMSQSPSASLRSRLISLTHPETQAVDSVGSHSRHLCSPSILQLLRPVVSLCEPHNCVYTVCVLCKGTCVTSEWGWKPWPTLAPSSGLPQGGQRAKVLFF